MKINKTSNQLLHSLQRTPFCLIIDPFSVNYTSFSLKHVGICLSNLHISFVFIQSSVLIWIKEGFGFFLMNLN